MTRIIKKNKIDNDDRINIKFKGVDKIIVHYNVSGSASIDNLFGSFCDLKSIDKSKYQLFFNDMGIKENSTIDDNNIKEDDTINVKLRTIVDSDNLNDTINLKLRSPNHELIFKALRSTRMGVIIGQFAKRLGYKKQSLKCYYNGQRVEDHFSPSYLDMEDCDTVDIIMVQCGG